MSPYILLLVPISFLLHPVFKVVSLRTDVFSFIFIAPSGILLQVVATVSSLRLMSLDLQGKLET